MKTVTGLEKFAANVLEYAKQSMAVCDGDVLAAASRASKTAAWAQKDGTPYIARDYRAAAALLRAYGKNPKVPG